MKRLTLLLLMFFSIFAGYNSLKAQDTPDTLYFATFDNAQHEWMNELFSYSPCVSWGPNHSVISNIEIDDTNPSASILQFPHCFPGGIGFVTTTSATLAEYHSISFKVYSKSPGWIHAQWFLVSPGDDDDVKLQQVDHYVEGGKWNTFTDNLVAPISDDNQYKMILLPDYRETNTEDTIYFDDITLMKTFAPKSLEINYSDINIDGTFDDWADDKTESLSILASGEAPADENDFKVQTKCAWDKENLYIYGQLTDDVIIDTIGDNWMNDAVEIALNMAGNDQFHAFWDALDPPDNAKIVVTKAEIEGIGTLSNEDITITRADTEDGWAFELCVPLKKLYADFEAKGGTTFNIGIQAVDNDNGIDVIRKMRWSGIEHINKTVPNSTITLGFAQKQYNAAFNTIFIDGDLSEWNEIESIQAEIVNKGYLPVDDGDFETAMKIAWDVNNLYLYGKMIDQTNMDDYPVGDMWKGDIFEIALNMAGDNQFNVFWDPGTPPDNSKILVSKALIDTIGVVKGADVQIERAETDGGWLFEMAIPFADLYENFTPTNDIVFNFDYQVADTDTAERESRLQWASDFNLNNTIPNSKIKLTGMPLVTADGVVTESDPWDTIQAFSIEKMIAAENISDETDFSAEVKLFWTNTYLSLLINVTDDAIFTETENVYEGDNIELYLDMNNSKLVKNPRDAGWSPRPWEQNDDDDFQIRLVPGTNAVNSVSGENETIVEKVKQSAIVGYSETENGYVFELNLNMNILTEGTDEFEAMPGTQIGFDLDISDNDNDPDARDQVTWNAATTSIWNDPSLWGTMQFVENHIFEPVPDEERPKLSDLQAEVTADSTTVELSWEQATDNIVADDYIVYNGADPIDTIRYETSYTITGLEYDTNYSFGLVAIDYSGNKSAKKVVDITTGSQETAVKKLDIRRLAVYPNPAKNKLFIRKAQQGMVSIYSAQGTHLMDKKTDKTNCVDISSLSQGVYFIVIKDKNSIARARFVKQ